ncbi:hypothetical protein UO65_3013 [Actinokineospora spheciospongiae]|uniref:Aminoglycoside phosphotransferase domain-containing protein n=1 Tax=Actinokineospora spheciospongiae TaxID=909613 RepID=W7IL85_9PSEU|nr:aminoglycoside phosphotransferase family protein [Actinokineospora spheciospongiae]EWC61655.1 hypothetical protein UO65_3013 [Actinokineospora spheciospongiae]
MNTHNIDHRALIDACAQAGLNPDGAQPLRLGENALYRLPHGVVVRLSRPGRAVTARKEVAVARWLARHDVPAVRALDIPNPVETHGRAATFWTELPEHRHGTPIEIAAAVRRLHELPIPDDVFLEPLDPFVRLTDRVDGATALSEDDRKWLRHHITTLRDRHADLPAGLPVCVIHGDAWDGNVVTTTDGHTVLLDLERTAIGPPEWDLVSTAVKHLSFGWITDRDYQDFCHGYGHDVTTWTGYELLRDIRELRMTCYLAQHATEHPSTRREAQLRVNCLRGRTTPRPWAWTPAT